MYIRHCVGVINAAVVTAAESKRAMDSEWTVELSGSQRISIAGSENKIALTVCLLLKLYYHHNFFMKVKTEYCHPNFNFPAEWNVWPFT